MNTEITTPEYIAIVQQQVCERLKVTMEALSETMLQHGTTFLSLYYKDVPVMARMLEHDRLFWNWWKNEWHLRNMDFLDSDEVFELTSWQQFVVYSTHNDPECLLGTIHPPRIVTGTVYQSLKKAS